MSDQWVLFNESCQIYNDILAGRGGGKHFVRNAGVFFDERADFHAGIHEALKPVNNLVYSAQDTAPTSMVLSPMVGRKAGCLKVYDYGGEVAHSVPDADQIVMLIV